MDTYLGITGNHGPMQFDKLLEIAAPDSDIATTGSTVIELGDGLVVANLVVDIKTAAAAAADVTVQFSADKAFTTAVAGPVISIAKDQSGRIIMPFRNDPAGTPLGYMRLMPSVAAKFGAFVTK